MPVSWRIASRRVRVVALGVSWGYPVAVSATTAGPLEHFRMTTENALLAEIIAKPEDDLPRLVFADFLDERGEPGDAERSEFIRVQILIDQIEYDTGGHTAPKDYLTEESRLWAWIDRYGKLDAIPTDGRWYAFRNRVDFEHYGTNRAVLIRRGFISEIRCTLAEWCGGECETCRWWARERMDTPPSHCPTCHGNTPSPGIGPLIVRNHPVTKVVLTDREPYATGMTVYPYASFFTNNVGRADFLPLALLTDDEMNAFREGNFRQHVNYHRTREEFGQMISDRLISWAKSQVPHLTATRVSADLTA